MCIRVQGRSHRLRREIQPPRNKRPRSNPWALFLFPVTSASQPPPPKEPHVHPLPRLNHRRRHRHCTYPTGRNVSLGHGPVLLLAFRNFTGVVKAGELLPVGFCSECRGKSRCGKGGGDGGGCIGAWPSSKATLGWRATNTPQLESFCLEPELSLWPGTVEGDRSNPLREMSLLKTRIDSRSNRRQHPWPSDVEDLQERIQ
jgi:hypothetical protein